MADYRGLGCKVHDVLPGTARAWWIRAEQAARITALCGCCGSPALYVPVQIADGQEIGGNSLCVACGGPAPVRITHEPAEREVLLL